MAYVTDGATADYVEAAKSILAAYHAVAVHAHDNKCSVKEQLADITEQLEEYDETEHPEIVAQLTAYLDAYKVVYLMAFAAETDVDSVIEDMENAVEKWNIENDNKGELTN